MARDAVDRLVRIATFTLAALLAILGAVQAYGALTARVDNVERRVTEIQQQTREDMKYIRERLDKIADRIQ